MSDPRRPAPPPEVVGGRLAEVRRRIEQAGGDPGAVTVVAVTKGFDVSAVHAATALGLDAVGENYASELLDKASALATQPGWHYIGQIQRRTVASLAPLVRCWQSVWRAREGETIARHAPGAAVLAEVNVSGLPQRPGCRLDEADDLVARLRALGLDVRGLMAVGPPGPPEAAREGFRALAGAARRLGLDQLSVGMSGDIEVAVSEGSTMVRVGTALFGPRAASSR